MWANRSPCGYSRRKSKSSPSSSGSDVATTVPSAVTMSPRGREKSRIALRTLRGSLASSSAWNTWRYVSCAARARINTMQASPTRRMARFTVASSPADRHRGPARLRLGARRGLVGDAQQQRHDHEVGDQGRATVGDERQRDAGEGDETGHAAEDEEGLDREDGGEPGGEQLGERPVGLDRDAEPGADDEQERDDDRECP